MSEPGRGRLLRAGLPALLLVGLVFLALRLHATTDELDRVDPPGLAVLVGVVLLALVGQVLFGLGWDLLWPDVDDHVGLAWSFHGAQPAKYVPIGVAQPVGQVALVRRLGVRVGPALGAWAAQVAAIVAAGLTVGIPAGLGDDGDGWARLALIGVVAPVLVCRPILVAAVRTIGRVVHRLPPAEEALPRQSALLGAYATGIAAMLCHGTAFALLAGDSPGADTVRLVTTYAFATGVSVATPLPAGLGVREGLIVAAAGLPAATALGAAVLLRLVLLGVELALFALVGATASRGRVHRSEYPPVP